MTTHDQMTSRERMLAAINRQPVDRLPTDLWATSEVFAKLRQHFGPDFDPHRHLHVDGFAWLQPDYVGPALPPGPVLYGIWGVQTAPVPHANGSYDEQTTFPLAAAQSLADLERFPWPTTDWFDYGHMRERAVQLHPQRAIQCGYMAPFYFHNLLRGLEQSLIDPLLEPEFTHELIRRVADFFYEHHRRMFEACEGLIDVAQVTDDLGSQTGPLISLDLYREFYAPQHRRFIDLCHAFGIKVLHHDDGACRIFLPLLVDELGIDILNPVQWRCPGMEMHELKATFGPRVCFHGAIENQQILPFGSPADVRAEVRHCIDALASDGTGYIVASCHNLQVNTPVENIVAMYDEARHYGRRP